MLEIFRVEIRQRPNENEFVFSSARFLSPTLNSGVARMRQGRRNFRPTSVASYGKGEVSMRSASFVLKISRIAREMIICRLSTAAVAATARNPRASSREIR
jgi:hypothetical protein